MFRSLSDLRPPAHGWAIGVGETSVFSVGEELLHGSRIPFHELVQCQLILLDESIYILYGSHLEITSTVDASSIPSAPLGHPTLFTQSLVLVCGAKCPYLWENSPE